MTAWTHWFWVPGFWQSAAVATAFHIGTPVALLSAVVGVFVVLRGQAFLGHALSDVGATGASGAGLVGLPAVVGFLIGGLVSGMAVEAWSTRPRQRDLATGVVLAAMLGLAAYFLYLLTQSSSTVGIVQTVLFGSLFAVAPNLLGVVLLLTATAFVLMGFLWRPLLFSTVTPDTARARGVPVRLVSVLFTLTVVAAVEQSALCVGALISTALLIGPAACGMRWARRPGTAMLVSALVGVGSTWVGIWLAYDSYGWPPIGRGWPVSFLITALIFLVSLASLATTRRRRTGRADAASVVKL